MKTPCAFILRALLFSLLLGFADQPLFAQEKAPELYHKFVISKPTRLVRKKFMDYLTRSTKIYSLGFEYRMNPKLSFESRFGFLPETSGGLAEISVWSEAFRRGYTGSAMDVEAVARMNILKLTTRSAIRGEFGGTFLRANYFYETGSIHVNTFGPLASIGIDNNIGRVHLNLRYTLTNYFSFGPYLPSTATMFAYFTIGYGLFPVKENQSH